MVTPESHVRVVVRPFASALPLGFFSFAVGMLLLAGSGNGWLPVSEQHTVGLLLAAFVFPLETIAAVVAFLARDTFGATGLGLFSSSWLTIGLADLSSPPGEVSRALGLYDFAFAFAIAALATKMMARQMEKLDIPPVPEFIELVADSGAKLWACKATVDMFGLAKEDFVPQVEDVITVGDFYALAAGGEIIFT